MKNFTEQLKEHWKSEDLTFIATYTRHKGESGFFNDFLNPVNKLRMFYPKIDGIEIENKRVSFYHQKGPNLIDGNYYKVELEFTNRPNGKNNPYSLKIKNISDLNQKSIKEFLDGDKEPSEYEGIELYGCYNRKDEKFASFENVMFIDSGEILKNQGEAINVFVSPNMELKEGVYYSFLIKENEGKLPNAITSSIKELDSDPYEKHIDFRFTYLNNPGANKSLATTMTEIGKGMYSSKQRMIFELLQNADDAPGRDKVGFHIDFKGDYFFIMHDGAPFSKSDVEAITRSGESTKRDKRKVTGYKGIGFKSVFTDSSEVWIKSGGYQFAFLRDNKLFEDFDRFYFSDERYTKYPDLLIKDKEKYQFDRLNFKGSEDIPWQLIPIWQKKLPHEFQDTNFDFYKNPIQIGLKFGKSHIDDYKAAIDNIVKKPQFLLFLRNTSRFNSPKNPVIVIREDENELVAITLLQGPEEKKYLYKKVAFKDIQVSNEAFSSNDIGLMKDSQVNDYNEITYFFTDLQGNKITTIPPKIASVSETEVSFGFLIQNGKLVSEPGYATSNSQYSSLFTYLPMEDKRFKLPFLVNGDFVPDSRREEIQGDNLWNKYIMTKVAEKHVETLERFALEFKSDEVFYSGYLSLLLKEPMPADDSAQQIIDSYNSKFLEQLKIKKIIVNDINHVQILSATIIDNSGIIELFGHEIFYEIIDTEKRLTHSNLDSKYLKKYDYLEVEIIDLEELASQITPEICERLGKIIAEKSLSENPQLLKWLDKLVSHMPENFGKLPFIIHDNSLFSLEKLMAEAEAWLINKNTIKYQELLIELGYHSINLNLQDYTNLQTYINEMSGYVNDRSLAYGRLAGNSNLSSLKIELKIKLIDFLQNSEFMQGIGKTKYFGELKLFVDENRVARPLNQLISRQDVTGIPSIQNFRITEDEYLHLTDALQKELITKGEVFTSFILNPDLFEEWSVSFSSNNINTYVKDLKSLYSWKDEEEEILQSKWAAIPWLYVNDELRFLNSEKIFWSRAFSNLTTEDYETITETFQKAKLKTLPVKECGDLIQSFTLKTNSDTNIDWTQIQNFELLSANILLDWMENDGSCSDFFEEYTLEATNDNLWSIKEIENTQMFDGSEKGLKAYIESIENLKSQFTELDSSLGKATRHKIGLLQGDKLLKAIIESKAFDQNLASFLPSSFSKEQLTSFISNLPEFSIIIGVEYNSTTPEHIIINQLIKTVDDINSIPDDLAKLINTLRGKIKINSNTLSDYNLSDRIQFGKGDEKNILKLSDVLEQFKGESNVLDELIESFVSITDQRKLRKLIFNTRMMPLSEVHSVIEAEKSAYYSIHQVVFQLLDKKHGGKRQWSKKHFDDFWENEENKTELYKSYTIFLTILFELNFTSLDNFYFHGLNLKNCVDKSVAIESELLPQWLEEWIKIDQSNKLAYLGKLGYNGLDSPIVKLREAARSENHDQNVVIRYFEESKPNTQIIWNTIEWLKQYSSQIITKNILLIKQINDYISLNENNLKAVTLPIMESISKEGNRCYKLQSVSLDTKLYFLDLKEEYSYSTFKILSKEIDKAVFTDQNCGNKKLHFSVEDIKLVSGVDIVLLENNSKPWDTLFYKKWEYSSSHQIYIYDGDEIPYKRTFKGTTVNSFTQDLKVSCNGKYYVSKILKNNIINSLPDSFPKDALQKLKDWHYKTLQDETLLDEDSYEYKEDIDRLLQDRLGISTEKQKTENGNAKTHAVYFLLNEGFDLSNVNSSGAALTSIIDPDGKNVKCIVRSAKGGLLYLDKEHWDMFEDNDTYLVVIYPGNSPRLFKKRLELLEDRLATNVLFRVPNSRDTAEIDGVFESLESESHLILVTSEKMKESLFSGIKPTNVFNQENDIAIADDEFSFE
ncbi:ATP-binding protein [Lunatibacter salilacus]|uniref:ATP-binding protein n=1 Tax=Lunatibacter salilacus TaxID=2483804 RepID=UPI00131C116D|nr:ATP-binding protein [Lunatibacter salilacus]